MISIRKSKEFLDTLDLTTHALTFRATGSRAEHLGLHKALCILMGWSSAVGPNGTWVRQALPDADALAQRKDLVIWPPMVIIHNSSIANPATDERVILSVEEMKAILRGESTPNKLLFLQQKTCHPTFPYASLLFETV